MDAYVPAYEIFRLVDQPYDLLGAILILKQQAEVRVSM